mmetsp:Transcript_128481/g.250252  ORF Transcript_128481/g.250252 Transcript_128481/m.250252 type:complete len:101 (-) Transcript_128481:228-530(-)
MARPRLLLGLFLAPPTCKALREFFAATTSLWLGAQGATTYRRMARMMATESTKCSAKEPVFIHNSELIEQGIKSFANCFANGIQSTAAHVITSAATAAAT